MRSHQAEASTDPGTFEHFLWAGNKAVDTEAGNAVDIHPPIPQDVQDEIDLQERRIRWTLNAMARLLPIWPQLPKELARPPPRGARPRPAYTGAAAHKWCEAFGEWRCAKCWVTRHRAAPRHNLPSGPCAPAPPVLRRLRGRQRGHCIRRYESDYELGPLYICVRCSAYAHNRRERLRFECRGPRTADHRARLCRVAAGRHPTRRGKLWSLGDPASVEQAARRWAREDRPAEAAMVAASKSRKRPAPDIAQPGEPPTQAARRAEELRQRILAREAAPASSCASSPSQLQEEDSAAARPASSALGPPRGEVTRVGEAASAATTITLPLAADEPPDALRRLLEAALAPIPEGDAGL